MASVNGKKIGTMERISPYTECKVIKLKGEGHDMTYGTAGVRQAETFFNAQRMINKMLLTEPEARFKITCTVNGNHYVGDLDFGKAKIHNLSKATQILAIMRQEIKG